MRVLSILMIAAAGTALAVAQSAPPATESTPDAAIATDDAATDAAYLAALRDRIRGREKEPAETVFANIETLRGRPAGAVLAIMEVGYNRSLGVGCVHCHDPQDWASDARIEKTIARRMSEMVRELNRNVLPSIPGLENGTPTVNCTTCHRGQTKPALDLPQPAAPAAE